MARFATLRRSRNLLITGAVICAALSVIPAFASAATWSDTIRYDELCGTASFSTCGTTGVTSGTHRYVSPYFNTSEPGVVRMSFYTPMTAIGDGELNIRFFGDFDNPYEYMDVMIEPPALIDSAALRSDKRTELERWVTPRDDPRQDSCADCFIEAGGTVYPYSRLANFDPNDDIFDDAEPVPDPHGRGIVELDEGKQWTAILSKTAILPVSDLSEYISDGVFELAFHFPEGEIQGNPFTDGATYTDEERANFEFNWLEATLTFDTESAPAAVPLPAPVLFLLSGLLGLRLLGRKQS